MPGNLIGDNLLGRIRAVTDRVEATPIAGGPMRIPTRFEEIAVGGSGRAAVRIATFTGAWSISALKAVTFKYQTATPNTVNVTNLLFQWPGGGTYDCAIARDGTAWFLVGVPLETANVSFLSGVSVAASLNTSNCAITVTKTETTSSTTFVRFKV